jgi:3-deoxy-7-phosphoheptulonate synthase
MEEEGLRLLKKAGEKTGMPVVTEVMNTTEVDLVEEYSDILQIGARNVQNFALLKKAGQARKPVLLKRGMMTTLEELLMSAEYILSAGNSQVILCERGIRTFETATRNTLDLNAVPVVRERSRLPVIVDPSHGTGRRAYVRAMARAAVACGAAGLLLEVHTEPDRALSDGAQTVDVPTLRAIVEEARAIRSALAGPS